MAPFASTVRLFPTLEAPSMVAWLLVRLILLVPELLKLIAPVSKLFWVKVIALAPALKLEVPGTVRIPFCVMAPTALTVKLLPTEEAANNKA